MFCRHLVSSPDLPCALNHIRNYRVIEMWSCGSILYIFGKHWKINFFTLRVLKISQFLGAHFRLSILWCTGYDYSIKYFIICTLISGFNKTYQKYPCIRNPTYSTIVQYVIYWDSTTQSHLPSSIQIYWQIIIQFCVYSL